MGDEPNKDKKPDSNKLLDDIENPKLAAANKRILELETEKKGLTERITELLDITKKTADKTGNMPWYEKLEAWVNEAFVETKVVSDELTKK